jgi:hypothetical protein
MALITKPKPQTQLAKLFGIVISDQNILNVLSSQKQETREIIKFALNLAYMFYTN